VSKEFTVGFIGFGEAGFNIAKGLRSAGLPRIFAYDIHTDSPHLGPRIQERAGESQTTLVDSSSELARSADVLFSTVTADQDRNAAEQTAPFLEARHIYADLNSVSPALKQAVEQIVVSRGAGFVEAAVMAPVSPYGHRVPMLLGGKAAGSFAELMTPYGMRLEVISEKVGTAAATKMFRSIIVKGLEALMLECVLGASRYDADERVFASLAESFPGIDWKRLADYMISRVVVHGERRAREMEEVAETLREIGIEPMMAAATARRQDWCSRLGLSFAFGPNGPESYKDLLEAIGRQIHVSDQRFET
jgi:3-hydroxyisobutyrate dehydrogenase-like beta-hydroxyacid dehydrogenase